MRSFEKFIPAGRKEFGGTPNSTRRTRVLPILAAIALAVLVVGCSRSSLTIRPESPAAKPPLVQQLERIFAGMPVPQFQQLTYEYTTQRGRARTEFTLITNTAAHADLAFVNYLPHGINPGTISGYGDLLALASVSSNTLPVLRTIQQVTVTELESNRGALFPLRVGNTQELRVVREWRQLDASGAVMDESRTSMTLSFRVVQELDGFADSTPPVAGKVFVVEQLIHDRHGTVTRHLHLSEILGACVRVVEFTDGKVAEERRLTGWKPLLYRPGSNL